MRIGTLLIVTIGIIMACSPSKKELEIHHQKHAADSLRKVKIEIEYQIQIRNADSVYDAALKNKGLR